MPAKKPKPKKLQRSRDWNKLRVEFARSRLSLAEFCRQHKIPYGSARKHLRPSDRDNTATEMGQLAEKYKTELLKSLAVEEGREAVAALVASRDVARGIMLEAYPAFVRNVGGRHHNPDALGRLALSAAEQLRIVSQEIQGIPKDDDDYGWPTLRGFTPLRQQRNFLLDWPSGILEETGEEIFVFMACGGVGSGKSHAGVEKFGELCFRNRGLDHGLYAPTIKQLKRATIPHFLAALDRKGITYTHRPGDKYFVLFGDTTVYYDTMDNPESLAGPNLAGALIDEGFQMRDAQAFEKISARVRVKEASEPCIIFVGSPKGLNWAYDRLVAGEKKNQVKIYYFETKANIHLAEGTFERLETLYDQKLAEQELRGRFIDVFKGKAYYNFEHSYADDDRPLRDGGHLIRSSDADRSYDRNLPLILMVDFNVAPMAWEVGQSLPHNGDEITYILDEIYIDTASTELAAREFVDRYSKHRGGIKIYGDAAGRHRHTAATRTDYQIIEDVLTEAGFEPYGIELHIGKSNPTHDERVKDVNARLRDVKRVKHVLVADRCERLIQDFDRVGFVPGTRQLDKTDKLVGHSTDGVGYYINREHAVRRMRYASWRNAA